MDSRLKGLNPKIVGDISQSMIMAALLKKGCRVLMPLGDNFRDDLVTEADGWSDKRSAVGARVRTTVIFV
jgi:hypothetical protein